MNALNQEFIEKTKEHENNLLTDKIKLENMEDWNHLRETIEQLANLYIEEEKESTTVKNCQNYLRLLFQSMKKIEEQYKKNFNDQAVQNSKNQLMVLCFYNFLCTSKRTMIENSKNENQEDKVEVTDMFQKKYSIAAAKLSKFQNICDTQRKLYNEFFRVYTCIYKTEQEQLDLLKSYDNEITNHKNEFLEEKTKITTLQQWETFKKQVKDLQENFNALNTHMVNTINFGIMNIENRDYMNQLIECITKIEEKYSSTIPEIDIPIIIHVLHNYFKYNDILTEKKKMITKKKKENPTTVHDFLYGSVQIETVDLEEFNKLEHEQMELYDHYKEAKGFIFGNNPEEEPERGM